MSAPQPVTGDLVAAAPKPKTRAEQFKQELDKRFNDMKFALPRGVDPQRFYRVIYAAVTRPPARGDSVLDCTLTSVFLCLIQCAQLGLEPNSPAQQAHLIPRRIGGHDKQPTCTLQIDYRGLVKLARNSGEIKSVAARVVYQKDKFRYRYGLDEQLVHVPSDDDDPGPVKAAYAVWHFKDGGHHFDVMSKRALDRIKNRFTINASSPWHTDEEEMQKKTVLRRSTKMVPMSVQMNAAVAINDAGEAGLDTTSIEVGGGSDDEAPPPQALGEAPEKLEFGDDKRGRDSLDEVMARKRREREAQAKQQAAESGADQGQSGEAQAGEQESTGAKPLDPSQKVNPAQRSHLRALGGAKGVSVQEVAERYGVEQTGDMTAEQYRDAVAWLEGMADVGGP